MQFPESWLREFCSPALSTQALADTLTMAGLEVEELQPVAKPFSGIVVGEIVSTEQHPNADRLKVCQVDAGQGALLTIVCGAPNARAGIRIPCALVGAVLPPGADGKPFLIKIGKLRGVESHGMLCSAKELGIGEGNEGLLELAADAPVGTDLRSHLQLDDTLFTLKLTPNLAHCLSLSGIARELAALTGSPLLTPPVPQATVAHTATLAVDIQASDLCGRFTGRIVQGVVPQTTPAWMVERLARCGQRSVSPLVDISNYVMFEFGQPTHIFDLDRIHGGLQVRWAREGESLKLLNGSTVVLDGQVGVIADERQVESLAGIMGGDASAVSADTRNIYIEAAFWFPRAVAGRSRRFNFSTDAGHRFERGVDPGRTVEAIERITALVQSICGGEAGPIVDLAPNLPKITPVSVRPARAAKVIGMPLTVGQCADALTSLGLPVASGPEATLVVTPPSWRFDLAIEEDLIEEIARMVGFDKLPTTLPVGPIQPKLRAESLRSSFAVRRSIAARGYQETINFSFVEESWERDLAANADPIRLLNPIASQMSVMRSSLMGSLLQVLRFNLDRKQTRVRAFELGRVFLRDAAAINSDTTVQGFDQPMRVAGAACGPANTLQWGEVERPVDFYDVKGDVEALLSPRVPVFEPAEHAALHPGRCARVLLDGEPIGFVGELHPRWRQSWGFAQAPVLFELDLSAVLQRVVPAPTGVPKQQDVERDIAIVVAEEQSFDRIRTVASRGKAANGSALRSVELFDVYRPKPSRDGTLPAGGLAPGEKSLALRLTLNGGDTALTEEQIESTVQSVLAQLIAETGARQRA